MREKNIAVLFPSGLSRAVKRLGFSFRPLEIAAIYICAVVAMTLLCAAFGLSVLFTLLADVMVLFFVPCWIYNYYVVLKEKQRFSEANMYIEQFLYSFMETSQIVTTLREIQPQFAYTPMGDAIRRALEHMMKAYDGKSDPQLEGLRIIEAAYGTERLRTIHRFALKAEKNGGSFDKTTDILLNDRSLWEERGRELAMDRRSRRNEVLYSVIASVLLCLFFFRLMVGLDMGGITSNILVQTATVLMFFFDLLVFTVADTKAAVDFLDPEKEDRDTKLLEEYNFVISYDPGKELKNSILAAAVCAVLSAVVLFLGFLWGAILLALCAVLLLFRQRINYAFARKDVIREIEKAFPSWLIEMALLLQTETVQVALYKSYESSPMILRPALEKLYLALGEHPTAVEPYREFLAEFSITPVQSSMKMFYAISQGSGGNFDAQIAEILRRNNLMMDKADRMESEDAMAGMKALFLLPLLFGSLLLIVDMGAFLLQAISGLNLYI